MGGRMEYELCLFLSATADGHLLISMLLMRYAPESLSFVCP